MITLQEEKVLDYIRRFSDYNKKLFPEAAVTGAMIASRFKLSKQVVQLRGKRLEEKGLIKRVKGKGSAYWQLAS